MIDLPKLDEHPFVELVLKKAEPVRKLLNDRSPAKVRPDFEHEPDEHDFFLLNGARSVIEVLNCCHQLVHIPAYLTSHRKTHETEKAGIDRAAQLTYHIENYLIRTQSLLDRVLQLTDAVFHLLNDPRECGLGVVTKNIKVARTDVPKSVNDLRKLLSRYVSARNEIIHRHSLKEDALRRLEMFFLLARWEKVSPERKHSRVNSIIRGLNRDVTKSKKEEFSRFNKDIASLIVSVFDSLSPHFVKEEEALRRRLSK
jgi:hypothetical protein